MSKREALTQRMQVSFTKDALLVEALTHRSYLNEHPNCTSNHNERLEFLGDAVLELVVTKALFTDYPDANEGELTAIRASLVNTQSLARLAERLEVGKALRMSRGESKDQGRAREAMLANAMEALIGALYLDQGIEEVRTLLRRELLPEAVQLFADKSYKDPKSALQELTQERFKETPRYKVLKEDGPAHDRLFTIGVFVGKEQAGSGSGASKQLGEVAAAEEALTMYES